MPLEKTRQEIFKKKKKSKTNEQEEAKWNIKSWKQGHGDPWSRMKTDHKMRHTFFFFGFGGGIKTTAKTEKDFVSPDK